MTGERLQREAWCAGRKVTVPVLPSPPDHKRVACTVCGVAMGRECLDLTSPGATLWSGHKTRQAAERRLYGAGRA